MKPSVITSIVTVVLALCAHEAGPIETWSNPLNVKKKKVNEPIIPLGRKKKSKISKLACGPKYFASNIIVQTWKIN